MISACFKMGPTKARVCLESSFPSIEKSHPTMCYYRRVRNIYQRCGHGVTLPDEEIKCDLTSCRFSPAHPKTCVPPQCCRTCWQYHQYPQQYSPHIDKLCPGCAGGAP